MLLGFTTEKGACSFGHVYLYSLQVLNFSDVVQETWSGGIKPILQSLHWHLIESHSTCIYVHVGALG
jgi:hypothetical protein